MTFKVLTDDTKRVIFRSNVRSAEDPQTSNQRLNKIIDSTAKPVVEVVHGPDYIPDDRGEVSQMPTFRTSDLVGRTFLLPKDDKTGEQFRARVISAIDEHENRLANDPERIKFLCSVNNDEYEAVMSYNDIMTHISDDEDELRVWKFKRIVSHQGPLSDKDPNYKGSKYNVMIEWENGETTSEPLSILAVDDPVTCAIYAKEMNLLDKDGWKRFKGIARRHKKFVRMVNQAKIKSYKHSPRYKYGYELPRNGDYAHAVELDRRNGNRKWQDSVVLERSQLHQYSTFKDLGVEAVPPKGYKKIKVHIVFDVKHDGRHTTRFVAGGHLTPTPVESIYSGVISL